MMIDVLHDLQDALRVDLNDIMLEDFDEIQDLAEAVAARAEAVAARAPPAGRDPTGPAADQTVALAAAM